MSVREKLSKKYFLLAARAVLGVVFIVASIEKIAVPETFAASVEAYRLVPLQLINIFVLLVPWLELLAGILLMAGFLVRASSLILSTLLCMFIFAMLSAMMRHLNIDCGCFGPAHSSPVTWTRLMEDVGLMVLGVYLFFAQPRGFTGEDSHSAQGKNWLPGAERI